MAHPYLVKTGLNILGLNWSETFHVGLGVEEVISSYPNIFNTNTGALKVFFSLNNNEKQHHTKVS